MDGPPAMALGLDPADEDLMQRGPRPTSERILTPQRWSAIGLAALMMAGGTLGVLACGPGAAPQAGSASVASTMALNTFVLFQFFNILNARSERGSVFRRQTFTNGKLWFAVTHAPIMQGLFRTIAISPLQWLVCAGVASSVLWCEELRKAVVRRVRPPGAPRDGGSLAHAAR